MFFCAVDFACFGGNILHGICKNDMCFYFLKCSTWNKVRNVNIYAVLILRLRKDALHPHKDAHAQNGAFSLGFSRKKENEYF